jgi:hypothetical protein
VGRDSLFDAIELRHCDALGDPLFIGLHCFAACTPGWLLQNKTVRECAQQC